MTAAMTGARRIEGESNRSNVHRTPYEIAPAAATCCGVSLTSSDTATATSSASPAANLGRRVARTTRATIEIANTSAACQDDTSRSTEMCRRLPSSPSSAPGPSPTRRVTWLDPPVAASSPTRARPRPTAIAAASATARTVSRPVASRIPSTAQPAASTTSPPPSAPALLQPTVTSESDGHGHETPQTECRPREQRHGDDDRRREVGRAVEAAALAGRGTDRRERRPRRLGNEHDEVRADERSEEHCQGPPAQQATSDGAEQHDQHGQGRNEHGRPRHVHPGQRDRDGERERRRQEARAGERAATAARAPGGRRRSPRGRARRRPGCERATAVELPIELAEVGGRARRRADARLCPFGERDRRRRDVRDRDEPGDARRRRLEDAAIAAADDGQGVARVVRVGARRRQRDVDRDLGRPCSQLDGRCAAGDAAQQRLLRSPADERRKRAVAADRRPVARGHEADRAARRVLLQRKRRDDDHGDRSGVRGAGERQRADRDDERPGQKGGHRR